MSNWCFNELTIWGPGKALDKFQERAVGRRPWDSEEESDSILCFNQFVPAPDNVLRASYTDVGRQWEIDNIGCVWGTIEVALSRYRKTDGPMVYRFDTAWSYPGMFVKKASSQYPDLVFILDYDSDVGEFTGRNIYLKGEEVICGELRRSALRLNRE